MELYDVIVIGGGPAGSTVGGFLTQMGRRVLILERERFPRHHIGESMIASTIDVLAEIGLKPKLDAAGFPVKSGGCFIWGESYLPWCIRFEEIPGRPTSYQVKRDVFDKILLDHVTEMGADVRQEARVTEILLEGDRVVGTRFDHGGRTHEARAKYVVDASGLNAVVANKISYRQPAEELENMALYGYWKGSHPAPVGLGGEIRAGDRNNIIIKMLDSGWLWFIPLGFGDLISVGYVTQRDRLPEARGRAALEEYYQDRIRASEEFGYLLSNSEYTGEFYTIKDWSYRSAEMAGPGYFAVGDAACFVDPILSSGVYLAVLYAKMCATGVNTCLDEPDRERLIAEWYEGLYSDTYNDYLAMARLWYHGDRKVRKWMHQAQDQLSSEVAAEYTQTDRSSFLGLATGNAHTHPNYVLLRELAAFPYPLLLRKDPRSGFHKEAHTALAAHADLVDGEVRSKSQTGMASNQPLREAVAALLAAQRPLVDRLQPEEVDGQPSEEGAVSLAADVRLALEVVGDRVEMVIATGGGQRRLVTRAEQALLATIAEQPSLTKLRDLAGLHGCGDGFIEELLEAGVLTPVAG
jgi:flavin-dependent dehydrogenase